MTWHNLSPSLKPAVALKTMPLPLLLPCLNLLTAPVQMLQEELASQLGQNVLATAQQPAQLTSVTPAERHQWLENIATPVTLEEHLTPQLDLLPSMRPFSPEVRDLLIQGLDPRGYFRMDTIPLIGEFTGLDPREFEALLLEIQGWVDPPGLFARDLVECLLLQLRRHGQEGEDPWLVLSEDEGHLAAGDLTGLACRLRWSIERLRKALSEIRRLDPRPGSIFSPNAPIIPEIAFEVSSKKLKVRLLHENLPRIFLEEDLLAYLDHPTFQEQWITARRVMTALAMRLRTKLRAARILAELQGPFLLQQTPAPGPAVLGDLAPLMGCHPSTVHRAVSTTWALSPRGAVLLSDLLSRPLRARPTLSVAQLRHIIAKSRTGDSSDRDISLQLEIPRRTVAWHRKRLGLN